MSKKDIKLENLEVVNSYAITFDGLQVIISEEELFDLTNQLIHRIGLIEIGNKEIGNY